MLNSKKIIPTKRLKEFTFNIDGPESKAKLEFYICDTNELNPHRYSKEIGIVIYKAKEQLDGEMTVEEIDSFIKWLRKAKKQIIEFNENN